MLVLSRKLNQSITIKCPDGSLIKISLCQLDKDYKARLGIEADKRYKITRTELIEKSGLSVDDFFEKF